MQVNTMKYNQPIKNNSCNLMNFLILFYCVDLKMLATRIFLFECQSSA